jgi:hypothetical protein
MHSTSIPSPPATDSNSSTCRIVFNKKAFIDVVHLAKVGKVSQINIHLDHIGERSACAFHYRLDVLEHLNRLLIECCRHLSGLWIERSLTRHVDRVAGYDCLAIWTNRLWRAISRYFSFGSAAFSLSGLLASTVLPDPATTSALALVDLINFLRVILSLLLVSGNNLKQQINPSSD